MSSPTLVPVLHEEHPYIISYNRSRWQHPSMQKYMQEVLHPNGQLYDALGPPLKALIQVPQDIYSPQSGGEQQCQPRRSTKESSPGWVIPFETQLQDAYGLWRLLGFSLSSAMKPKSEHTSLIGYGDRFKLSETSQKITHRLLLKGLPEACKGCSAYRADKAASGLERRTIAHHIAAWIWDLMDQGKKTWSFDIAGRRHTVTFDHLLLLAIHKVSDGSYQPVLAFRDELEGSNPSVCRCSSFAYLFRRHSQSCFQESTRAHGVFARMTASSF